MGASLWHYIVEDDADVGRAFETLQAQELKRLGEKTLERCRRNAGEDGTHSIIDMVRVVDTPAPPRLTPAAMFSSINKGGGTVNPDAIAQLMASIGTIFKMSDDELRKCFGTTTPTAAHAASLIAGSSFDFLERGSGRYAVLHTDGQPSGVFFCGVSGD